MTAEAERGERASAPAKGGSNRRSGFRAHPLTLVAGVAVLIVVAIAILVWWLNARNYESTDDAFIDTQIIRLAPQTAGRVTEVMVTDNQLVQPGQAVLTIDSADLSAKAAQADAARAQALAQADNAKAQVAVSEDSWRQSLSDLAAANATADNAAADLARYRRLAGINRLAVSQQQLDQASSTARQTAAQRDAAAKAADSHHAQAAAAADQASAAKAAADAAKAQVDEAKVNLGYTRLIAPIAGHVTQKSVGVGDYVQAGTEVLAIVPLTVWVTANFKETQLKRMHPGQKVSIRIDACPRANYPGRLDSIQRGAGQAFGVLPAQNATGNFVKVVQRVPVKITFDQLPTDCPLGPGMSVSPRVRVR